MEVRDGRVRRFYLLFVWMQADMKHLRRFHRSSNDGNLSWSGLLRTSKGTRSAFSIRSIAAKGLRAVIPLRSRRLRRWKSRRPKSGQPFQQPLSTTGEDRGRPQKPRSPFRGQYRGASPRSVYSGYPNGCKWNLLAHNEWETSWCEARNNWLEGGQG